jgi:hypothetical protein
MKNDFPIFYLIDYHLPGSSQNGIEFIESIHAKKTSILVTNNFDDPNVRDKCEAMGIKILPKMLASTIPVFLKK